MEFPIPFTRAILNYLGLPDLNWRSVKFNKIRLQYLREQLYALSDDLACNIASESYYPEAYLAFNFPMNFMKVYVVLGQIMTLYPSLFTKDCLRILDIGCGEGAAMFAAYSRLGHDHRCIIHGIDASRSMVKKCLLLFKNTVKADPRVRFKVEHHDLGDGLLKTKNTYDIIILSNSLVEILGRKNPALRYIERISKRLSACGVMMIIEPALKATARRLMELHNTLQMKKSFHVLFPCLHSTACPLLDLRDNKEWCHRSIPWKPPEYMRIINQGMNREIDVLKFAYLVISNSRLLHPEGYVVISKLLREKGKKKCFLCSENRRIEVVRLNKHKSLINSSFDGLEHGNIVLFNDIEKKKPDHWQITEKTQVSVIA